MSNETGDRPTDLRIVGRSEDGSDLELTDDTGGKYAVRISDTLRSTINQPVKSHLSAVVNMDEQPIFSVKDIQARLRAGDSMDSISRTTDWPLEKIERFAGPILQERAYVIEVALKSGLRRNGEPTTLGEATIDQLTSHGVDLEDIEWNTHRNHDGTWQLVLHYDKYSVKICKFHFLGGHQRNIFGSQSPLFEFGLTEERWLAFGGPDFERHFLTGAQNHRVHFLTNRNTGHK